MPFSSQQLHGFLGFDGNVEDDVWDFDSLIGAIQPGGSLRSPAPLYTKLDASVADEESQRLGVEAL